MSEEVEAIGIKQMPDDELLTVTEKWFRENTEGASIAAASEVIALASRHSERITQLEKENEHCPLSVTPTCALSWPYSQ